MKEKRNRSKAMREQIAGKTFDEERALYYLQHADVQECTSQALRTENRC